MTTLCKMAERLNAKCLHLRTKNMSTHGGSTDTTESLTADYLVRVTADAKDFMEVSSTFIHIPKFSGVHIVITVNVGQSVAVKSVTKVINFEIGAYSRKVEQL